MYLQARLGKKVNLIAMATDGAMKKGAHAGNLIKEVASIVGGGGGGTVRTWRRQGARIRRKFRRHLHMQKL